MILKYNIMMWQRRQKQPKTKRVVLVNKPTLITIEIKSNKQSMQNFTMQITRVATLCGVVHLVIMMMMSHCKTLKTLQTACIYNILWTSNQK